MAGSRRNPASRRQRRRRAPLARPISPARPGARRHSDWRPSRCRPRIRRALMLDPVNPDIHLGLGLLRLESDRLQDAIQCFRRALQHAPAHSLAGLCLAHALYAVGDFPAAAVAFEALTPLDVAAQRKLSAAALLRVLIEQGPDGFDVACSNPLSGHQAVDLLNHYGHARAAIALGRHLLAQASTDAILHYQVQAIEGAPLDRAPPGYIEPPRCSSRRRRCPPAASSPSASKRPRATPTCCNPAAVSLTHCLIFWPRRRRRSPYSRARRARFASKAVGPLSDICSRSGGTSRRRRPECR